MQRIGRDFFIYLTAAGYAAAAAVWIFLSDRALQGIVDPVQAARYSMFKGLAFIAVTTALLIFAMKKAIAKAPADFERVGEARLHGAVVALAVAGVLICAIGAFTYFNATSEVDRLGAAICMIVVSVFLVGGGSILTLWRQRQTSASLDRSKMQDYLGAIDRALPGALVTFRLRPDGSISIPYASERFAELTGLDPASLVDDAAPIFKYMHPDDIGYFLQKMAQTSADMSVSIMEFRELHPTRGEIWFEARTTPERAPNGDVQWHGVLFDITSRKRDEEQLRLASTVFDNAAEGVVVADPDTRILAVNPAFTAISGYTASEAIGQHTRLLQSGRHDHEFYREMWTSIREAGHWRGEIWNRRKNGEIYPQWLSITAVRDSERKIVNYVSMLSDMSKIKQSESQLEYLSHHDPLTGLPNRLLFRSRLEHALVGARRFGQRCAVLHLNIDGFAWINDSLGYPAGDELLVEATARLQARLQEVDTLARIDGDQFLILLENIDSAERATDLANVLIADLSHSFTLTAHRDAAVGGSIGISFFPEDGATADLLLQHAHAALTQSKRSGGGCSSLYSAPLTKAASDRLELVASLRRALDNREFELHYQPLVRVADRRTTGAEALLRWRIPGDACVSPALFIPTAEETGLIVPIGDWALRAACRQMRTWRETGLDVETIAVNLSPIQFRDGLLVSRVRNALEECGLPGECLELEITEGALMEASPEIEAKLDELRSLGVRLAIDDFGAGYSSLAYLKRFPIHTLKIDRSFIRDVQAGGADSQITTAILSLGNALGLRVLAEGVETEGQLAFLRQHGCDSAQGWLFAPAMPAAEFADWLQAPRTSEPQLRSA
jgi:diguanylate cyclase (GGDEF)-like protein/PAS domain S-box-containing protein